MGDEDDSYLLTVTCTETVGAVQSKSKKYLSKIFTTLVINKTPVKFQLDCGATVSIISEEIYQSIFDDSRVNFLKNVTCS